VQVTTNTISEVQQETDIRLTHEELQPHFDEAYTKYRAKVELKGFRKGRAPLDMIKRVYGEAIEQEALSTIANDVFHRAVDERNIRPLGTPSMVDMDFKRGSHLQFKVKYEVTPVVELNNYKGIAVERPVHPVTDAEVEDEIQQLRKINSTTTPADTAADDEHIITADVQELDETGTPLIGRKSPGRRFYLADATLAIETREALRNARVGEPVTVKTLSKHGDIEHALHLSITPKKIEKVTLPAFDEELVKKVTRDAVSSPEEFRASMRRDLERYWTERADSKVAEDIANEIVRAHNVPVPDTMVEVFLDSFVEEIRERSRDHKLPAGFDEKQFREERRVYAVWQTKWLLLKDQIAVTEQITVTDEDVKGLARQESARTGITPDKLLQHYKKSDAVRERILSAKIAAFLRDHAHITDKEVQEPREA
jgi:trigger factor